MFIMKKKGTKGEGIYDAPLLGATYGGTLERSSPKN